MRCSSSLVVGVEIIRILVSLRVLAIFLDIKVIFMVVCKESENEIYDNENLSSSIDGIESIRRQRVYRH